MTKKKLVLFDIDYTLFNTDVYKDNLTKVLGEKLGFTHLDQFEPLNQEASKKTIEAHGHFVPEVFLKNLIQITGSAVPLEALEKVFWQDTLYATAIDPKIRSIAEALAQKGVKLGILSTGNEKHQRQKLHTIVDVLTQEHIHIFVDKIEKLHTIVDLYKAYSIFIVDDLLAVLSKAKELDTNIYTIWMNRPKKYMQPENNSFVPDSTIDDLSHVTSIILNN